MRYSLGTDQAEGLRRLLVCNPLQVVPVVGGKTGVGRTSTVINLATAITRLGKDVLVLDENDGPHNLSDMLGTFARYDLLDVIQEKCKLQDAIAKVKGFSVLPIVRALHLLPRLLPHEQQHLENALAEASKDIDVILIDTALQREARVSSSLANGVTLLVVVDATASGITESYALIKRMVLEFACLRFAVMVNKVNDAHTARTVFHNMAKVAKHNLSASLEYVGFVPKDEQLQRACRTRKPVVDAFPRSVSAQSYMELSQKLLHLSLCDEDADKVQIFIKTMMQQISQPILQNSKKVAHDVNY